MHPVGKEFFLRDVLEVAPALIGSYLVRQWNDGSCERFRITETEAYRGEEDLACHASHGRTKRTEVLYWEGGVFYVYLIYGMYWMLNCVTGRDGHPQAALIRGLDRVYGPGRLTKQLQIDRSLHGKEISFGSGLWIERDNQPYAYAESPRIGINYAGEWTKVPWRYTLLERLH